MAKLDFTKLILIMVYYFNFSHSALNFMLICVFLKATM